MLISILKYLFFNLHFHCQLYVVDSVNMSKWKFIIIIEIFSTRLRLGEMAYSNMQYIGYYLQFRKNVT